MQFGLSHIGIRKPKAKTIFEIAILVWLVALGAYMRFQPIQYGWYLDEFDPYIQYKGAERLVNEGLGSWFNWVDSTRWYPNGANQYSDGLLGMPLTGYLMNYAFSWTGLSLLQLCILFPAISGIVCTLLSYILGRKLVDSTTGLIGAAAFTFSAVVLQRTSAGFFDSESGGLLGMFVCLIGYFYALDSEWETQKPKALAFSLIGGLGLIYMMLAWRGYYYILNLLAVFVIGMILIGKWKPTLSMCIPIFVLAIGTQAFMPFYGFNTGTLPYVAAPLFAMLLCLIYPLVMKAGKISHNMFALVMIGLVLIGGVAILLIAPNTIAGKFISVMNPFAARGEVGTVGEQNPSTLQNIQQNLGVFIAAVLPIGIMFGVRGWSIKSLFISAFAFTAIWAGSSFVRLLIFAVIAGSLAAGYSLHYVSMMVERKETSAIAISKKAQSSSVKKWYGVALVGMALVSMLPMGLVFGSTNRPAIIASAALGTQYVVPDWLDALAFMRNNLTAGTVIGAWWDYGYWINVVGNQTVIDDNSTNNSTQISLIAKALLSNESVALEIFAQMGVQYFVVYQPWWRLPNGLVAPTWTVLGDFEKSTAMMVWAGYESSDYIGQVKFQANETYSFTYPLPVGSKAHNCLLYQMVFMPLRLQYQQVGITIDQLEHFSLVYQSSNQLVMIYKVNYP